jgi:hypothetical protein
MRMTKLIAAAALLVLAGCGNGGGSTDDAAGGKAAAGSPLFPDDFKGVCSGGSVSKATPYDAKAASHKVLLFSTYKDDLQQSTTLPPDWTVQFSPEHDALKAVDLVGCARRTADKLVKTCDGYEKDGKSTGGKVRWHSATYELSVHEATTGKKLDSTSVEATSETCPMFASFDGKNETIDMYATAPDTEINDFLKPYVKP